MAEAILVPQVGQDLTEAKVVALHVKLGDKVKKGDVVAEVESEKASFEVEAFTSGTVIRLPYKLGDVAIVLQPLLMLGEPGEEVEHAVDAAQVVAPAKSPVIQVSASDGIMRSSPLARRLAARHGLEIFQLDGSGPRGAVVQRDIEAALVHRKSRPDALMPMPVVPASAGGSQTAIAMRNLKAGVGEVIVFVHGFGADLSSWRPFVEHLTLANPMLGLDLPAHGASPAMPNVNFETLVERVAGALVDAGHARIHLVGHSLGAAVAAAIAGRGKPLVRSLTLIAPAGLGPKINGDFIAGFLAAESESALGVWLRSIVHDPAILPAAMVRATFAAREGTEFIAGQRKAAAALFAGFTQLFSIREALARYAGPCRIIQGREDSVIPPGQAENLPGHVALHRLAGVGHLPQLEAAALVGRLVAETVKAAG